MLRLLRASNSISIIAGTAFILAGMTARACAATVHITFFKARNAVEGVGNLFYKGERYRLQVEGIAANSLKSSRFDLAGSVEDIQAASDIIGAYEAAEAGGGTIVGNGKSVRIRNKNGVILDIHGINRGNLSLDLSGMTVTSRGWGPDAKERVHH